MKGFLFTLQCYCKTWFSKFLFDSTEQRKKTCRRSSISGEFRRRMFHSILALFLSGNYYMCVIINFNLLCKHKYRNTFSSSITLWLKFYVTNMFMYYFFRPYKIFYSWYYNDPLRILMKFYFKLMKFYIFILKFY